MAGSGAPIRLDFLAPGGASTGKLLPTSNVRDVIDIPGIGEIAFSFVDASNPVMFVTAESVGATGSELPAEIENAPGLLQRIETIRRHVSVAIGAAPDVAGAARVSMPRIAYVARMAEAKTLSGRMLGRSDADIMIRMIARGLPNRAVPVTTALCLAVACRLPGTIPHSLLGDPAGEDIRVAHPSRRVDGFSEGRRNGRWLRSRACRDLSDRAAPLPGRGVRARRSCRTASTSERNGPRMKARQDFRRLLAEPGIHLQPVVYDPLGARIAEDVGFTMIALGGYAVGAHLAITEPLASLDEFARITRSISLVSGLPIMVDAGAGYGEPLHVMHTVRVLEQAGAASIHLEDQYFPKRVRYHQGIEDVIPAEEMVKKLRAALAARSDPDFLVVARTDAMRTDGYDEGIRRARLYVEAGAEAIMLFPNDEAETKAAPKDLPGVPLVYVNSTGNSFGRGVFPAGQLQEWGWKIVYDAISSVNVTARAMREFMSTLKATGESGLEVESVTKVRREVERTIGLEALYKVEEETLR